MVEDIIKAVNHAYVYVSRQPFDLMIENCKEKLLACSRHQKDRFKAFFDCEEGDAAQLISLLDACASVNTLFLGYKNTQESHFVHVYKQKIYPGDQLVLEEDVMIVQDIPSDCYIECYGSLIVVGSVCGCIDFRYADCCFAASSLYGARVRIFDSEFHKVTSFSSTTLYYENGEIKREDYLWDAVLESPQVREE